MTELTTTVNPPHGWVCPNCGHVYAPLIVECTRCGHTSEPSSTTTTPQPATLPGSTARAGTMVTVSGSTATPERSVRIEFNPALLDVVA
jgi:hypothetical protein